MNKVRQLHEEAMNLAEMAFVAKLNGQLERASQLTREAFQKEVQAASLVSDESSSEPTRSILHRSAASLALNCNEFREAERLIARGLAGNPPEDVAQELRDLFDEVNFERHLDLRGVTLEGEEVQISIAGNAVSGGMAASEEVIVRIEDARKLIYRTVERLMGRPYREGGAASRGIVDYELYVSVPRAASFAVSLKVSSPKQPPLPGFKEEFRFVHPAEVIDEIMSCLELFSRSEEKPLHDKIPQEAYYRNFVGIAKNIAPDGNQVKIVGFTSIRDGKERRISLTTPRKEIKWRAKDEADREKKGEGKRIMVIGTLLFADEISIKNKIKLVDEKGETHRIVVPEGMMSDIVRPLWKEIVQVTGFYHAGAIHLEDITKAVTT